MERIDLPDLVLDLSRIGVKVGRNMKEVREEANENEEGEMVQG